MQTTHHHSQITSSALNERSPLSTRRFYEKVKHWMRNIRYSLILTRSKEMIIN